MKRTFGAILVAAVLMLGVVATANARAQKTEGTFAPVPGHGDFGISGTASLIRTGGKTIAKVNLEGLEPGETYGVHVHNAPCSVGGGGHYQNQIGGPAAPPNELWPSSGGKGTGITATPSGNGSGYAKAPWIARPEAQSVVVHHYADSSIRVACAQLS